MLVLLKEIEIIFKLYSQLPQSLQVIIKVAAAFTATYSEHYYSNEHKVLKFMRTPQTYLKYLLHTDLLSQRLVDIYKHAEGNFNKALFEIFESKFYGIYQALSEHKLAVNRVFQISTDPLDIFSEKHGKLIDIPVPSSHLGVKPIACRLLSSHRRKGMVRFQKN
jgi:hypothetical protein